MINIPFPLPPPEADMSGFEWFPLDHLRLPKSRWWRRASDLARARNVMLWCEAFQQVPAGSLKDDDDELAEAAGFGMDTPAFIAVKAEIMAPWYLHTDGRWYHPTVCEKVLDIWKRTSERRKADAERKRRSRENVKASHETSAPEPQKSRVTEAASRRDIASVTVENLPRARGVTSTDSIPSSLRSDGGEDWSKVLQIAEPGKRAWAAAIHVLTTQGDIAEKSARGLIGRIRKDVAFEESELLDAAAQVRQNGTLDPAPLLRQTLKGIVSRRGARPVATEDGQTPFALLDEGQREIYRRKMRGWLEDPSDWPTSRGPQPNEPFTRHVPPEIMAEFGYGPLAQASQPGADDTARLFE